MNRSHFGLSCDNFVRGLAHHLPHIMSREPLRPDVDVHPFITPSSTRMGAAVYDPPESQRSHTSVYMNRQDHAQSMLGSPVGWVSERSALPGVDGVTLDLLKERVVSGLVLQGRADWWGHKQWVESVKILSCCDSSPTTGGVWTHLGTFEAATGPYQLNLILFPRIVSRHLRINPVRWRGGVIALKVAVIISYTVDCLRAPPLGPCRPIAPSVLHLRRVAVAELGPEALANDLPLSAPPASMPERADADTQ